MNRLWILSIEFNDFGDEVVFLCQVIRIDELQSFCAMAHRLHREHRFVPCKLKSVEMVASFFSLHWDRLLVHELRSCWARSCWKRKKRSGFFSMQFQFLCCKKNYWYENVHWNSLNGICYVIERAPLDHCNLCAFFVIQMEFWTEIDLIMNHLNGWI